MQLTQQGEEFHGLSDLKYAIREEDRIPKSSWFVCRAVLRSRALRVGRKLVTTRGSTCGAAPRRPSLGPPECNCFVPCRDRHCCRGPLRISRWQKKKRPCRLPRFPFLFVGKCPPWLVREQRDSDGSAEKLASLRNLEVPKPPEIVAQTAEAIIAVQVETTEAHAILMSVRLNWLSFWTAAFSTPPCPPSCRLLPSRNTRTLSAESLNPERRDWIRNF